MEPNASSGLSSYFQQPTPPPLNPATTTTVSSALLTNTSPTNGILPSTSNPATTTANATTSSPLVYGTVPSAVGSGGGLESGKRKRGRPRKYGTPGEAAAAKRLSSAASTSAPISPQKKKDLAFATGAGGSSSSKKYQLAACGSTGQSFTPNIISVAAGEDVGQKIMLFMQQSKREICILSASGSVSNASLRQPATSGGSVSYEGRYDILSLCGSYVQTELGGKTGGLSVCLSSTDGQIIGGGVGGPLIAAGPIQVIVGTFLIDPRKDIAGGLKGDTSTVNL